MTALHETAYPRLKSQPTPEDLVTVYTPNQEELELVRSQTRQPTARLGFMVLLKTFQRLGYFVPIAEVPEAILNHLMTCLELKSQAAPLKITILPALVSGISSRSETSWYYPG